MNYTLPLPVEPKRPPPANAILFGYDLQHASYWRLGILVWKLHNDQWTVFGYVDQWPEPLVKENKE